MTGSGPPENGGPAFISGVPVHPFHPENMSEDNNGRGKETGDQNDVAEPPGIGCAAPYREDPTSGYIQNGTCSAAAGDGEGSEDLLVPFAADFICENCEYGCDYRKNRHKPGVFAIPA